MTKLISLTMRCYLACCGLTLLQNIQAQSCDESGNVAIFSNYDGGNLIIDVNVDIPDLKIGISSYEPINVSFTGAFVGNITEVIYAGFQPGQPGNNHCNGVLTTNVNAPAGATVAILNYPPVTLQSPLVDYFGLTIEAGNNGGILGCYSCENDTYQGGANTAEQVIDFFLSSFGGELRFLKTQYGCWCGEITLDLPPTCCQEIDTSTPAVSITAIPSLQLCAGEAITLDAGPGYQSYAWSTGATSQTIVVDQPGTYSVEVSSTCGTASAQVTTAPCDDELNVTIIAEEGCLGSTVAVEALVSGGEQPYSYQWTPAFPNTAGPIFVDITANAFTLTLQVTDGAGNVAQTSVVIESTGDLPAFDLGSDFFLCDPQIIGAEVPGADGYLWSNGSTDPFIQVDEPGVYTLTVTNACGSSSASVEALPCTIELSATVNSGVICAGESISLTVNVNGGVAPYTYLWTPALASQAVNVVSPLASTVYIIVVTDSEGTQVQITAEVEVINESLNVNLGGPYELCDGPITLNAFQGQALAYQWNTGSTQPSISVSQAGTYTVTVSGACSTVSSTAVVVECTSLQVSLPGTTICPGGQAILQAQVSGGAPPYQYNWSPSLGDGPGPFTVSPGTTSLYTLSVTDLEGNEVTVEALVQVATTPVLPLWDELITLCPGEPVVLSALTEGATSYLWSTGSNASSIVITNAGTYSVTVITPCITLSRQVTVVRAAGVNVANVQTSYNACIEDAPLPIGLFGPSAPALLWADNNSLSPVFFAESSGTYTATLENTCGGQVLNFEVNLEQCECSIFVPNAFTPDGNGINDVFKPVLDCEVGLYEFKVFDRWGALVFESFTPDASWRGEHTGGEYYGQAQIYTWTLTIQPEAGAIRKDPIERNGYVTLMR